MARNLVHRVIRERARATPENRHRRQRWPGKREREERRERKRGGSWKENILVSNTLGRAYSVAVFAQEILRQHLCRGKAFIGPVPARFLRHRTNRFTIRK